MNGEKYTLIRNLCGIIGELSKWSSEGAGKIIHEFEDGNINLEHHDSRLVGIVFDSIKKINSLDEENVINNILREHYSDDMEYIIASVIFYDLIPKTIVLQNGPLVYFDLILDKLNEECTINVLWITKKPDKSYEGLIIDPLNKLTEKDGFVIDLAKFKCYKEELPQSLLNKA